jgi:hypothetical protein
MIQHNKKALANSLLLLAVFVTVLVIGCGRTPPAPYWTWSQDDSIAIVNIVNTWQDSFATISTTTYNLEDSFNLVTLHSTDTIAKLLRQDIRSRWMIPHYFPRSMKREFSAAGYQMSDSFTPVKDTTVMVKLVETFNGVAIINADSATMRDPLRPDTVVGNDTFPLYSDHFYYAPDTVVQNNFSGNSIQYLYFDKKDGPWKLRKISGGGQIFVPNENDAPYMTACSLRTSSNAVYLRIRPDTTQYGIQRFYNIDSIFNFHASETLAVWISGVSYSPFFSFGFLHYKHQRYNFPLPGDPTLNVRVTYPLSWTTGFSHMMFELAPWENLCEHGNYNALFWIIPMKILP